MLLDHLVNYCDSQFKDYDTSTVCDDCNHPTSCSGSCDDCLTEIHWYNDFSEGKKEYDCPIMLNYYICKYSYKYCSEIEYALNEFEDFENLREYNIMSIGCGGAPDLMALEFFMKKNAYQKPIKYVGYDINKLWKPIHNSVCDYCKGSGIKAEFHYVDAIEYFRKYYVKNINVIVLQYIISYFYNTNQTQEIESFFDELIDSVIKRGQDQNTYIIINDVNSCYKGRNYFLVLVERLKAQQMHGKVHKRYFDYAIKKDEQRFGRKYNSYNCLHAISSQTSRDYKCAKNCSSAQLLIRVKQS